MKIVCRHCAESIHTFNIEAHNRSCASLNYKLGFIRAEFKDKERFAAQLAAEGMRGYSAVSRTFAA